MSKKRYELKSSNQEEEEESYIAPPPPRNGKIVGLDCHPDSFTAAVFVGQTPHDARKIDRRENLTMEGLLKWAGEELSAQDIILMEAGTNSFEVCRRLGNLGLSACVLESAHVGKHAKTYADNDRMAAARIALVYLAGNAPCVWVPDEQSRERRELLHAYNKAVAAHTAATNSIKAYLNGHGIRLAGRNPEAERTREWILGKHDWSALQKQILAGHFENIAHCKEQRKSLHQLIAEQAASEPQMLRVMKVLGVGIISAFALVAVIGNVQRFHSSERLVAYIGLNPGQRQSGKGKDIRLGVGKRGRGDIRHLLIQGAQAVLRAGRNTDLGKWGWRLFARKGSRNIAVAAVARKLLVQVWHTLVGNPPALLESTKSFTLKLFKLAVALGAKLRSKLDLGDSLAAAVDLLLQRSLPLQSSQSPVGLSA